MFVEAGNLKQLNSNRQLGFNKTSEDAATFSVEFPSCIGGMSGVYQRECEKRAFNSALNQGTFSRLGDSRIEKLKIPHSSRAQVS